MSRHNHQPIIIENQQGYSLVELMIVVAIVGILGTYAKFNYSSNNARLNQATRDLYSNMQKTKIEAIKRNERWGIIFDYPNVGQYCICSNANVNNNCSDTGEICEETTTLSDYGSNISFGTGNALNNCIATCDADGITYGSNAVVFKPSGILSGFGGYAYLQNSAGSTYAVGTPTITGAIQTKQWDGAWR